MKKNQVFGKLLVKITLICFLLVNVSFAAPYHGNIKKFKQPDGTMVDVRLYGTEFYMRGESIDGYTLVRDKQTQWICYARLNSDSTELISTNIVYQGELLTQLNRSEALALIKHIDIKSVNREKMIAKKRQLVGLDKTTKSMAKTPPYLVAGSIKGLCVVVDFSDEPGTLPMSEFENFCNNLTYSNYGNSGSLRKLYFDYSGGLVDYQNVVYGYFRAPLTFAAYDQMQFGEGAQQVLGLALNWIAGLGFDFSTLTHDPDGTISAINLMFTGNPPNWAEGMWFHQGYYNGFSSNGVHSGPYNCSPATDPLEIAVVAHENGHMIGRWPDTYKYTSDFGVDGIGSFDLMCYYGDSYNPVPPNPHFATNAGWGNIVDVSYFNGIISDTANSLTIYKYINPNDTNEFFLFKNRMKTGRSSSIPDQGLTIWHIDRNGDNQTFHHEVYLEHANNDINNQNDACFHLGHNVEFGETSTPNSKYYNLNPSGLRVWDISNYGNVMTYKIGAGQPAAAFQLQYLNFANDPNGNGFLEPSESGDLKVQIKNLGQVVSGNAIITCTAIGANSSSVTINNATVNVGVVNLTETLSATFNITLASNTPIGTLIDFKFQVSDGIISNYISKQLLVGQQILIGESPAARCSGIFMDNGGYASNYSNNYSNITTLSAPANSMLKVQFLEFDLEASTNCVYDYLKVFNGASITSPLIGRYCGTTIPATITASNSTGALTFQFRADEGMAGTGWKAIVTCVPSVGINDFEKNLEWSISPNPFNDFTTVVLPNVPQTSLKIVDLAGNIVFQQSDINAPSIVINKSTLASGVYFVQLTVGSQLLEVKKMVVY